MFKALAEQNPDHEHIALLQCLYKHQRGIIGDHSFPITRGVRQGDVLSPILFNAVLEHAMERWKQVLTDEGFVLSPDLAQPRLTNIRYADDLLLFGKSLSEAVDMLEKLATISKSYGLEPNMKKTKIISPEHPSENTQVCITDFGPVDVLGVQDRHKYLGRLFTGDLKTRGKSAIDHRLSCGWMKFKAFQHVFEDKQVSVKLRFKLFDSIVSSTILYGLDTARLTAAMLHRIDVTQRTMLRRIVGWVCYSDDSWGDNGRRMANRLRRCLELHPLKDWSEMINERKAKMIENESEWPYWTKSAVKWSPVECARLNFHFPYRVVGHPHQRWNDNI